MAIGSTTGWPYLSTTSSTKMLLVLPASSSTASTTTSQFNLSTIASTSRSTTYFGHPLPFLSLPSWSRIWAKSSWWGTRCSTEGSARCPFPLFSHSLYSFSKMFAEPDDEEKRVFPLVLHRSLARGRYILWMGKSVNLFWGKRRSGK